MAKQFVEVGRPNVDVVQVVGNNQVGEVGKAIRKDVGIGVVDVFQLIGFKLVVIFPAGQSAPVFNVMLLIVLVGQVGIPVPVGIDG